MIVRVLFALPCFLILPVVVATPSQDSRAGWPDIGVAGYGAGRSEPPRRNPDIDVRSFGAKGDGRTDDTESVRKAIAAGAGKVIRIPTGRYLVTGFLDLKAGGTVLQGDGPDKSILVFPKGLEEIEPHPVKNDGGTPTSNWSWSGGFVRLRGSGLEGQRLGGAIGGEWGGRSIRLDKPSGLKAGDMIVLTWKDKGDGAFVKWLYAGDTSDASGLVGHSSVRQVVRVTAVQGTTVEVDRRLRCPAESAFEVRVSLYQPKVVNCGIEALGFEFPRAAYAGHFKEIGSNAIALEGVAHCWVREVRIHNADSGIFAGGGAFNTIRDVVLTADRPEGAGCCGHHGIQVTEADSWLTGFDFRTKFIHDITLSGGSAGVVVSKGKGVDLALDFHCWAPIANVLTDLDCGLGKRVWSSGGGSMRGRHAGRGNIWWNLRAARDPGLPPKDFACEGQVFAGVTGKTGNARAGWTVLPSKDLPASDLHEWMRKHPEWRP